MSEIVVVGGGVAGICCAYYLRRQGESVTILESNRVGSGASFANGGWLCPAQAGPLPEPGLGWYGVKSLSGRDATLYFKMAEWRRLAPWLVRFWTYCNPQDYLRGTQAIAQLGRDVFNLVEEMRNAGASFDVYKRGMVYATWAVKDAYSALRKLTPMRRFGYTIPDDIVAGDELHNLEPALSHKVEAGFLVDEHWYVKADEFTAGLADALRRDGVQILENTEATEFVRVGKKIAKVRTATGEIMADAIVLAAGSWTTALAGSIGIPLPMQAGKGYSFSVRPSVMPTHAILLADSHVGCTPFDGFLRIGGSMEFSGINSRVDQRRIQMIITRAQESFHPWASVDVTDRWAGMRPITADGLPVIDRASQFENVFLATGYAMQGVTLSPSAGRALAEFVTTGSRPEVLDAFRLDRFAHAPLLRPAHRRRTG